MALGAAVLLGIDLAWGPRNRTGLAVCDDSGLLLASGSVRTDDEIAAFLGPWTPADPRRVVAAIDAPLVVPNATGRRDCEAEVGRVYGRYDAGAHPANRSRAWFDPPRGAVLADRFGWDLDPETPPLHGRAVAIEVYPHPAMVSLFGLGRVVAYKQKRGRDLTGLRTAWTALLGHLERVAGPTLQLQSSPRWAELQGVVRDATRKSELRAVEDEVDAIMCAYLAWLWAYDRERWDVFGDLARGYIAVPRRVLAPVTPRAVPPARSR